MTPESVLFCLTVPSMQARISTWHPSYPIWIRKAKLQLTGLPDRALTAITLFISAAQQGRTGALDAKVAAEDSWTLVTQQTAEWNAEKAQQIVQSVIDSGTEFNVIYAENDDMAKGAVAALDKANISHGVGKDVIVMGFDCNKWALQELLAGNWNYDGQCNPFQATYIDKVIKQVMSGEELTEKTIIMDEKGFDAEEITEDDVNTYGI